MAHKHPQKTLYEINVLAHKALDELAIMLLHPGFEAASRNEPSPNKNNPPSLDQKKKF